MSTDLFVPHKTTDLDDSYRLLTPTAVKTSAYTAAAGDLVPVDTTSGAVTVTLPNAPSDMAVVCVKHVIQGGTNAVTVNCAGSDVFNKAGGATSATLSLLAQAILLQYKASAGIWYVVADDLPLAQLDLRYQVLDGDLTAIAALDASTAGAIASDGAGWIKKTYAQLKTALALVKADVGLGSVDNTADSAKSVASAAVLTTARTINGVSFDGSANITNIAEATHTATSKATPVDADELSLVDSAASNVLKKLTWSNLKATLKTYFDTIYVTTVFGRTGAVVAASGDYTAAKVTNAADKSSATAQAFSANLFGAATSVTKSSTGSYTPDASAAMFHFIDTTQGTTMTLTMNLPTNTPSSSQAAILVIQITNDGGGTLTISWNGGYAGGASSGALVTSLGAGASVFYLFVCSGSSGWRAIGKA